MRVSENRVMRKIFAAGREKVKGDWKHCIMKSF
jgi:hypothetical protein